MGTWRAKLSGGGGFGSSSNYRIIEFLDDNRYRELWYTGRENDFINTDTTGTNCGLTCLPVTFEDSVFYEISNDFLRIEDTTGYISSVEIIKLTTNKITLKYGNGKEDKFTKL